MLTRVWLSHLRCMSTGDGSDALVSCPFYRDGREEEVEGQRAELRTDEQFVKRAGP